MRRRPVGPAPRLIGVGAPLAAAVSVCAPPRRSEGNEDENQEEAYCDHGCNHALRVDAATSV